jgi:hypothetical protein
MPEPAPTKLDVSWGGPYRALSFLRASKPIPSNPQPRSARDAGSEITAFTAVPPWMLELLKAPGGAPAALKLMSKSPRKFELAGIPNSANKLGSFVSRYDARAILRPNPMLVTDGFGGVVKVPVSKLPDGIVSPGSHGPLSLMQVAVIAIVPPPLKAHVPGGEAMWLPVVKLSLPLTRWKVETPSVTVVTTIFVPTSGLVVPAKEIFPGGEAAMVNVNVGVAIAGDAKSASARIFNTDRFISLSLARVLPT